MVIVDTQAYTPIVGEMPSTVNACPKEDVPAGTDELVVNVVLLIIFMLVSSHAEIECVVDFPSVCAEQGTGELSVEGE